MPTPREGSEMDAYAVVLTHIPETGETLHTSFSSEYHDDPLSGAHAFRESEEARGDFPGALWAVTGNDAAVEIRSRTLLVALGMADDDA